MKYSIIKVTEDTSTGDIQVDRIYESNDFDKAKYIFSVRVFKPRQDQTITITLKNEDTDEEYESKKFDCIPSKMTPAQIRHQAAILKVYKSYAEAFKYIDDATLLGWWRYGTPKNYKDMYTRIREYFKKQNWLLYFNKAEKDGIIVTIPSTGE